MPAPPEELMPDGVLVKEIKQQNESEKCTDRVWLSFQAHTQSHSLKVVGSLLKCKIAVFL